MLNIDDCCEPDAWWFMSYHYVTADGACFGFGSLTWRGPEKPWQKIQRWNEEMDHRQHALIAFQLCRGHFVEMEQETHAYAG